ARLRRRSDRPDGGKNRARPQGLSRRRAGAHRQRRCRAGPKRHLRQHHPGRDADVLRPAAATARRRRTVSAAGDARRQGRRARLGGRQRHLGISRAPAYPYPFDRHVLGRLLPARPPCASPRARRPRPAFERRPPARAPDWSAVAEPVHQALLQGAWNDKRQAFTAAFGSDDLDASVLLLPDLGVIEADDPRFVSTVKAMERELLREKHVMRYASADDFGLPATAFLICRFWLVDAWWSLGRREEAHELFVDALAYRNRYGLLSEDIDPQTGTLWGNFPQTYSMAGLILTAMRLSRSWED